MSSIAKNIKLCYRAYCYDCSSKYEMIEYENNVFTCPECYKNNHTPNFELNQYYLIEYIKLNQQIGKKIISKYFAIKGFNDNIVYDKNLIDECYQEIINDKKTNYKIFSIKNI